MRFLHAISALALIAAAPAIAQDKAKSVEDLHKQEMAEVAKDAWAIAPVEEKTVSTHRSVTADGRALKYTATAGTLTIRDNAGKPTQSIFYTADTLDGVPGSRRPITFFYNGGPGSASLWLRMGSFGPTRIQTGSPDFIRPAPFSYGSKPDTL